MRSLRGRGRPRTVFAIRCRTFNAATRRMHQSLSSVIDAADIYFVSDARESVSPFPSDVQVIHLTTGLLDRLGLQHAGLNTGWQCGDYCFYALADATAFDWGWLIEPDVYFAQDIGSFFNQLAERPEDLLAATVERRESDWFWHRSMSSRGYREVWGTFFPLIRLSRSAVERLHEGRRALPLRSAADPFREYPNDEAFVATTLVADGATHASLADSFPGEFSHFQWRDRYLLPDFLDQLDGPKVLHSALDAADFTDFVETRLAGYVTENQSFMSTAVNSLLSCSPEHQAHYLDLLLETIRNEVLDRLGPGTEPD